MEQLLNIEHSHSNKNNSFTKQWYFTIDNVINTILYEEQNIKLKTKTDIIKRFYIKNIHEKIYKRIYDIDEWLEKNIDNIKKSNNNYKKCFELVDYISENIGTYTFKTTLEIGWYIEKLLKLTLYFYEMSDKNDVYIVLNYKNKNTVLTEQKLKTFIQKNKKAILQMQEKNKKEYELKMEELNKKQKEKQELDKLELQKLLATPGHDATKKVGSSRSGANFYIRRSLKERYLTQACKPLPEKYPWENNNN